MLLDNRVPIATALLVVALCSVFVLGSQSASSIATYLLAVLCVCGAARWRSIWLDRGFLLVVALLVYIPMTSLWSVSWDARDALSQALRSILVLTFVVAVAEAVQVDWFRRRMILALTAVGGIAAAGAIGFFFAESPEDGRLNGLGQLDTHVVAAFAYAVAALSGLAFVVNDRDAPAWIRWLVAVGVAVLVVAVALTGSRNAVACLLLGAGCIAVAHRASSASRLVLAAAGWTVALGAVVLLAYWFVPGADAVILPRGDSFRPGIWSDYAAQIVADGPWFGLGVLSRDPIEVGGFPVMHPHGLYLSVAYQGGILALALMFAVIATASATLLRHFRQPEAILGLAIWALALPGFLLDGHELVDKVGWIWFLFWLPVGIALGLRARPVLDDARRFGTPLTT